MANVDWIDLLGEWEVEEGTKWMYQWSWWIESQQAMDWSETQEDREQGRRWCCRSPTWTVLFFLNRTGFITRRRTATLLRTKTHCLTSHPLPYAQHSLSSDKYSHIWAIACMLAAYESSAAVNNIPDCVHLLSSNIMEYQMLLPVRQGMDKWTGFNQWFGWLKYDLIHLELVVLIHMMKIASLSV